MLYGGIAPQAHRSQPLGFAPLALCSRRDLSYNILMDTPDPLDLFLPAVRDWFRATLGEPTPPQRHGWPAIAAGQHTLILAPTGSGKTLAAFLACLDHLWRQPSLPRGVQVLYISPLKALNNDIHRNLQAAARRRRRDGAAHGPAAAGPRRRRPHRRHAARPSGSAWSAGRRTSSSPRRSRCTCC